MADHVAFIGWINAAAGSSIVHTHPGHGTSRRVLTSPIVVDAELQQHVKVCRHCSGPLETATRRAINDAADTFAEKLRAVHGTKADAYAEETRQRLLAKAVN
jgi:hypothetical protein